LTYRHSSDNICSFWVIFLRLSVCSRPPGRANASGGVLGLSWLASVPRMRVRTPGDRQKDLLADLAVLNEQLSGAKEPWEIRRCVWRLVPPATTNLNPKP
jgi:hypothetical protein